MYHVLDQNTHEYNVLQRGLCVPTMVSLCNMYNYNTNYTVYITLYDSFLVPVITSIQANMLITRVTLLLFFTLYYTLTMMKVVCFEGIIRQIDALLFTYIMLK